jgi:hypothetical protein
VVVSVAAFLAASAFASVRTAAAQEVEGGPDTDDQVVLTGRLIVPEGETVGTAVIFNGDAVVEGTVSETLVVFNGRVEITGTVEDDVISFNGRVVVRSGAEVGGDIVSRRGAQVDDGATVGGDVGGLSARFDFPEDAFLGRFVWWVAYSVSTLVLGFVLLALARRLDRAGAEALRERLGGVIGFGVLWFFLLPVAAIVLLVLVVTIPLALFLLLGLALVYTIAYVVGAITVGRSFVKEPTSRALAFLAGWGALRLLALVPVLGGLAWLAATIVGLGTLWVIARARPREPAPMVVPPPPSPA